MRRGRRKPPPRPQGPRVNNRIRIPELQVIDESGTQLGVMKTPDALRMAREKDLDLVEVSPNVRPPIAKIMDYGKFQYLKAKESKEHKKAKPQETKSVRVGFKTGIHDLDFKAKRADKFLQEGNIVKVELTLRGRERAPAFADMGRQKLLEFVKRLETPTVPQGDPRRGPYGWIQLIQRDKRVAQRQSSENHGKSEEQESTPEASEDHGNGESAEAQA
jgi:translation initiation factor IF-3